MKKSINLTIILLLFAAISTYFVPTAHASINTAEPHSQQFLDVSQSVWYSDAIDYVVSNGIMSGTSDDMFEPQTTATRQEFIEALYQMDGAQDMLFSETRFVDVAAGSDYVEAVAWGVAYDIIYGTSAETYEPDASITREQVATILYRYASHKNYDLDVTDSNVTYADMSEISAYAYDAVRWTGGHEIFADDEDGIFSPKDYVTRAEIAVVIARFAQAGFNPLDVITNGLTLICPSKEQMTICPGRDFYVIGNIDDSVTVPDDAVLTVLLQSKGDLQNYREVFTNIKNNEAGMYVDYPGIDIDGSREAFRQSLMPDLVYDPSDPTSFDNTWIKAYYTDEHYTCVVYGGTYKHDINPVDQYGNVLEVLPEGDYILTITLTSDTAVLASAEAQITIGQIPNKVLSRFSPTIHYDKVEAYADAHGYVEFLDPFPGYWMTTMIAPDWGIDYVGEIPLRWRLADREEYIGGKIHVFDYNISEYSTSYSVELGQLAYDRAVYNPDRISYCFYDIGEPEITQNGVTIQGNFIQPPLNIDAPVYFPRVDVSQKVEDNYLDSAILNDAKSYYDLKETVTLSEDEYLYVNGVCYVIQPEQVVLDPDTETFTLGNKIAYIEYTISEEGTSNTQTYTGDVSGLERVFSDGSSSVSVLEFRHSLPVLSEEAEGTFIVTAQAKGLNGAAVGNEMYVCTVTVAS